MLLKANNDIPLAARDDAYGVLWLTRTDTVCGIQLPYS
jgi:hypothetical protein